MQFTFSAALWLAEVEGASWVFVTLPEDVSDEIEESVPSKGGFGSVRVEVTIGGSVWRTSLFPDTKAGAYILPIKKAIRTTERLEVGDTATMGILVLPKSE